MKHPLVALMAGFFLLLTASAQAALVVRADDPKQTGKKVVIKLTMTNTFQKTIEAARAQIFLLDDQGKVSGQSTQWVIEATKAKPGLAPGASATYHFVLPADKPFTSTKLTVSRIVFEGGELANPQRDFELVK